MQLKDIQGERDLRKISLDKVGVKNLNIPVVLMDKECGTQHSIASVNLSVSLPHEFRGTHMSRFIEILEAHHDEKISPKTLKNIAENLCEKLNASQAFISFKFKYFIRKAAPVSKLESCINYDAGYEADLDLNLNKFDTVTSIIVPVQTLCPCSKEISAYGAHNQRALIDLKVRSKSLVWFEELIAMAESSGSSPLYTLLKRPDEKFVTEHAYNNPRFVEDTARELALKLDADARIIWYEINITSCESIHNHDAFAEITRNKLN